MMAWVVVVVAAGAAAVYYLLSLDTTLLYTFHVSYFSQSSFISNATEDG